MRPPSQEWVRIASNADPSLPEDVHESFTFSSMTPADVEAVFELRQRSGEFLPGLGDDRAGVVRFLTRNPGLSQVVRAGGVLVAAALAGHDGRRGYLHHVVVDPGWRKRGIGRTMVQRCVDQLLAEGIEKVSIDVVATNEVAAAFWTRLGWMRRDDLVRYSFVLPNRSR